MFTYLNVKFYKSYAYMIYEHMHKDIYLKCVFENFDTNIFFSNATLTPNNKHQNQP